MKTKEENKTKFQKFADNFIAIIKIIGPIILAILTGKFIYDFFKSKDEIKIKFKQLKQTRWSKSSNDYNRDRVNQPLSSEEINEELKKLD